MGVKGLNHFITRFEKNIVERINMQEEIENWILDHDGKSPLILIDLKETAHIFVQRNEIGLVLGGRFELYNKMLRQFVENLNRAKAKLVFFMPGSKYTDDLQFFIPKTEVDYISALDILDKIEQQENLKDVLYAKNKFSSDIRMGLSFNYNLNKLVRRYGEYRVNFVRHNQEIARYAKDHSGEVLAVITNDTDFMAFEGDFEYWRANGIDYRYLTGYRYCKKKLYARLDLNAHQMQLLSALGGSNYLPRIVIEDFIQKLMESSDDPAQRGKILNVAAYVRRQPFELVENKPRYDLERISRDVFGEDYSTEQLNSIGNGLACYDLNIEAATHRSGSNDTSFLKFCKTHDMFLYKLATDDIFNIKDIAYIDFRNCKSKTYAELIIPILMKICGILFKNYSRRPCVRKICMKHAHDEPSKLTEETVIYPKLQLPELFDLIFKNKERQFDKSRWPLLEWLLDLDNGFVKKIQQMKNVQNFAAVIATLEYLVRQEELTAKEANAILYTEYKVRNLGNNQSDYPDVPNANSIRIAHLYVKIYVLVSHCFDVCGLHEMTDLIQFDGALFHKIMDKYNIANEEQIKVLKSFIEPIWTFS